MGKGLTTAQVAAFRQDGFVFPLRAIAAEEAAVFCAAYDKVRSAPGTAADGSRIFGFVTHLSKAIRNAAILAAVEDLIGPDVLCGDFNFFDKAPDGRTFVSWHQDGRYWTVAGDEIVTAWLALTPSHAVSGCMRMLPGSHRGGVLPHAERRDPDNMLSRGQVVEMVVDEGLAVDIVLAAGAFSLHHVDVAHSSQPNRSGEARIGLAIRYISPRATASRSLWGNAVAVRGAPEWRAPHSMGKWIAERLRLIPQSH